MNARDEQLQANYEIKVQGKLDQSWESFFDGMMITPGESGDLPTTTLIGAVADQPALRGLLCKLWDLNLTLISARRIGAGIEGKEVTHGRDG